MTHVIDENKGLFQPYEPPRVIRMSRRGDYECVDGYTGGNTTCAIGDQVYICVNGAPR